MEGAKSWCTAQPCGGKTFCIYVYICNTVHWRATKKSTIIIHKRGQSPFKSESDGFCFGQNV